AQNGAPGGPGLVFSTNIVIASGIKTLTLSGSNTDANAFNGVISDGAGTLGLIKSGTGSWTLGGTNTFTNGVTINAGTLIINNAGALNKTAGSESNVTFGPGADSATNLNLNGNSITIASLVT